MACMYLIYTLRFWRFYGYIYMVPERRVGRAAGFLMGVMARRASRASRRKFILVFMPCMYLIPCLFGNFTAIYGPGTGELAGDGGVFDGRDGATSEARFATLPPVFDGDVNESVEGWRDGDGQRKRTASGDCQRSFKILKTDWLDL
ncbi:hypothetical protein B0H11DRAFT_1915466 [Mycena galericulata]|nr:hypothetical protein B0H11DRAFT_1915465 [Mycena galericulata]KAJ7481307.1 hypothetical protein B0H11DRAFT_1915466 [Mycena galericulata]